MMKMKVEEELVHWDEKEKEKEKERKYECCLWSDVCRVLYRVICVLY